MTHSDELEDVLNRLAEAVHPSISWEIVRNPVTTRVKAVTAQTFSDREAAWRAATELADALSVGLLAVQSPSEIGAFADEPSDEGASWRGVVDLNLRPPEEGV